MDSALDDEVVRITSISTGTVRVWREPRHPHLAFLPRIAAYATYALHQAVARALGRQIVSSLATLNEWCWNVEARWGHRVPTAWAVPPTMTVERGSGGFHPGDAIRILGPAEEEA